MARVNEISIGITGKTDGIKKAVNEAKTAVRSLEGAVGESAGKIENAFAGIGKSGGGAASAIGGIVGAGVLLGIGAAAAGFRALAGIVEDYGKQCFAAAVETERWQKRMDLLVGSGEEAKAVLGDIIDFSKDAPIAIEKLAKGAERILVLTGEKAFASISSMRKLADIAVFTGSEFDATAEKVGKFFQSLQAGKTDGVAALKDAGVVTADFIKKLEALVKRQGTVREAWALFMQDTERARGAMEKQRDTWDGALEEMKNMAHDLASEIGEPFKDAAKKGMKQVIDWIKGPEGEKVVENLKKMAKSAGDFALEVGPKLVESGLKGLSALGEWFESEQAKNSLSWMQKMADASNTFTSWMSGKTLLDMGAADWGIGSSYGRFADEATKLRDGSGIDKSGGAGALMGAGTGRVPFNPFGAQGAAMGIITVPEQPDAGGGRLGTEPKGRRGKKGVSGQGWLADMLDDWVGAMYDEASRNAQAWGELTEDIARKTLLLAGATKEQMLAFELQDGRLKGSSFKDLEEQSAKLDWALEAKARRKDMIEQLRDQARETGSLALVEETLSKAEMTQSKMLFAAYTARARQTLAVEEGRRAADAMIRGYREEMGLIPKLTEHARALIAVWSDPKLKGMSAEDRGRVLGAAKDKDVFDAKQGLQGFISDLQQQLGIEKKISQEYILREKLRSGQFQGGWKDQAYAMFLAKSADGTLAGKDSSSDGLNSAIGMSQDAFDKMRHMQDVIANGADRMANVLLDSFLRIGEGADSMFDNLIGGFRSVLADMAAEFLQSQIRGLLFNILGGIGGRRGGLSDASSSGGGQSMVSAAGTRAPVVVNMPVYVQDPGGLKKSMGQIQQEAFAKAAEASRRNG